MKRHLAWPVSVAADVPKMGLPACEQAAQAGCILSWLSFAEPANTSLISDVYDGSTGFTGQPRRREDMLCVNPLTGIRNGGIGQEAARLVHPVAIDERLRLLRRKGVLHLGGQPFV